MRLEVDAQARALYLRLRHGKVHETRAVLDHRVIVDLDQDGELLAVEVLDVDPGADEFGYAHVDVAMTTSEGRATEVDPKQLAKREGAKPR